MADYPISKEAVIKKLLDLRNSLGNERYISIGITMALNQFDGFPQMDAVPVVRCKECVDWQRGWECTSGKPGDHYCAMIDLVTSPDFYCKHGAKMDAKDMDVPTKDGGAADA